MRTGSPLYSLVINSNTLEGKGYLESFRLAVLKLRSRAESQQDKFPLFASGILEAIQSLCPHHVEWWSENGGEEPHETYICGVCGALEAEKK